MSFSSRSGLVFSITIVLFSILTSCNVEKPLFPKEKILFINTVKVKKYPLDTPFVFYNTIQVKGTDTKEEKNKLSESLAGYWEDSLVAGRVRKFGFFYTLKNPPIFDSSHFLSTIKFMKGYLFSQGYFNPVIKDTFLIDTFQKANKPTQYRTYVAMNINTGRQTVIDSLSYNIFNDTLQSITLRNESKSFIEPGKTSYSKQVIASELDRLVAAYRRSGYFMIKRSDLVAEVDTADINLFAITTDPFIQARLLAEAEKKRLENPTAIITIKDKLSMDSAATQEDSLAYNRFYVGKIFYYPETRQTDIPDSLLANRQNFKRWQNRGFIMLYNQGLYNPKVLREHTYMRKGILYNEDRYYRTLNNFSQMGTWRQVDTRTVFRKDTIDFHIFLYPEKKQNITYNLEASRNTGDFLSSSDLFGLSVNITYRNRNLWHNAIQSSTSLRNGVELSFEKSNSILQSVQSSLTHTLSFPRLISPIPIKKEHSLEAVRTVVNLNASYSERKDFFRLRSFVSNWGYEWKKKKFVWQYRPLNIELYSLDTLPLLDTAFRSNPFLRNSFNSGSVVSQQISFNYTYPGNKPNINNYIRGSFEAAGTLLGRIKSLQDNIYQYVKVEGEYRKTINLYSRREVAFRLMGGIGFNYSNDPSLGNTLPFFKQFVAGGPNSMRAWGLRLLGLGSSLLSDTSSTFRDRYGDVQLETNIEYRFPLMHFTSVDINGALFTDIGNIWNLHSDPNNPLGSLALNRLGSDIAIGAGTGVRFDFNFFLIRVDLGFKLKDPARRENNGWLDIPNFTWRNKEFVKYDSQGNLVKRNNFAIQLGIGLPF